MRKNLLGLFVVVALLSSVLPASAQKDRSRQRTQPDSRRQAVSRPQGGARLPVVRTDRSWRRAGIGTLGWGGYDGYYDMSWRSFSQEVLGAAIVGGMMGLASRHQNDVVVVQQPVQAYINPVTQQPIPLVYQPPAPVAQPVMPAQQPVQKVGAPSPDDYRTDGVQNATARCIFNGGDTARNAFAYPIIVRQVAPNGGVRDMMTLMGGQSVCLPQVPLDGTWWYEAVARVNVNGGVSTEGDDLRVRGGVELGRLFAQGFPGGWLFAPPPVSERQ